MEQKGLLGWIVRHSFGLIKNTSQAAIVLLVAALLLIGYSFMNAQSDTVLQNSSPHPVGR